MSIHSTIIYKLEESSIWPGTNNAFKCQVLNNDNTKSIVDIPKETVDLNMYLKSIEHKLTKKKLIN